MFKSLGETRDPGPPPGLFLWAGLILVLVFAGHSGAQEAGDAPAQTENPAEEAAGPAADPEGDFGFFEDEFEEEFGRAPVKAIYDPLRGYNRMMTIFNDKVYFWILKPTTKGYRNVVPQSGRKAVNRFFQNLAFPIRFVNNVLQLKFKRAGVELTRFTVNTTLGVAGFGDPAKKWFGLESYPEDFGQTLAHYGAGSGFYFVIPFLGPSNFRDLIGASADIFTDPVCYLGNCYAGYYPAAWGVKSYDLFNETSLRIGEYESLKKDALDFYTFLRDASEESRKKEIAE
ncbi:MAG TPA: VacJ family lipoprotein [Nitrospiria bacterium]|nr:VacJ family lipoprotein [Nitrospiria bacterium]